MRVAASAAVADRIVENSQTPNRADVEGSHGDREMMERLAGKFEASFANDILPMADASLLGPLDDVRPMPPTRRRAHPAAFVFFPPSRPRAHTGVWRSRPLG